MSNTRHAEQDAPLSQERYMSSPEYTELRGIGGNAVSAKAELMDHPAKRSLLYFVQALSLQPGGLPKVCRDFLSVFADRIGSPTMHGIASIDADSLSNELALKIRWELDPKERQCARLKTQARLAAKLRALSEGEPIEPAATAAIEPHLSTLAYFKSECVRLSEGLPAFLVELCVNPQLDLAAPGESPQPGMASLPWFKDIVGGLYEYRRIHDERVRRCYAETEISRTIFDALDVALKTRKMVMVEGNSGIGKTTATEAWCSLHLGEARYVSLSGVTHKTGVFRAIAKTLGLASSYARTATEMQARIEDVLQRSGLVLVIDEAHFLFSGAERVYSRPELVDWVNTSLYNHGVPAGLVCTPQFRVRMERVEKQTGWNADQLRRRVKRVVKLPTSPCKEDLVSVARKLLPQGTKETISLVVGYALFSKRHLPALVDVVDEARLICGKEGRQEISFLDCKRAIDDYCAPTAAAWSSCAAAPVSRRARATTAPKTAIDISPDESPDIVSGRSGVEMRSMGAKPVDNSPFSRRAAPLVQPPCGEAAEVE